MNYPPVNYSIIKQGGPIVNGGHVVASGVAIVAIEIDMKSKRCDIDGDSRTSSGAPVVWLSGANALYLQMGQETEHTGVAFPDYSDWEIFSAHVSRYTLRVCLVRVIPPMDTVKVQPAP